MLQNKETPYYLYKITNNVNGKLYIGVTKDFNKRKKQHINGRRQSKSLVGIAIRKYGASNFSFEVICIGSESYIYDLESKAIAKYNSHAKSGYGYNISLGGKGGEGSKIESRSDDKPIYVKGFWFPNKRTCISKMNIPATTLYQRITDGSAGEVQWLRPTSTVGKPVYVGGFWFPDIFYAEACLSVSRVLLKSRINIGQTEQQVNNPGRKKQKVYVNGSIYNSLCEAGKLSGYTRKMLYRRFINDPKNFYIIGE